MAYTTIGSSDFNAAYYGSNPVREMWYGNSKLWPKAPFIFGVVVPDDLLVSVYNLGSNITKSVDWGDGVTTVSSDNYMEHTYAAEDEGLPMNVSVSGDLGRYNTPFISNGGNYDILSWGVGMLRSRNFTGFSPLNGDSVLSIPDSWIGVDSITSFSLAFYLTLITTIPDSWVGLENVTSMSNSFRSTDITAIPDSWRGLENVTNMGYAFKNTPITTIPNSWVGLEKVTTLASAFAYAPITTLADSWTGLENVISMAATFAYTSITTFPTTDYTPLANVVDCSYIFTDCTSLTSDIYSLYLYLSTKEIPVTDHYNAFYNCTNALNYDLVPASWGGGGA